MKRMPLTLQGAERLRAELKRLKTEERPRIIQAIAEARSHGDLSENAEYHAAREQQSFIEGRIKDIEAHCRTPRSSTSRACRRAARSCSAPPSIWKTRTTATRSMYQIVGDAEADIKSGLISVSSPIARALVGKSQGDIVDVVAPNGTRTYEIVAVKYV